MTTEQEKIKIPVRVTKHQIDKIAEAYGDIVTAVAFLRSASNKLKTFGPKVPEINPAALKDFGEKTNEVEFHNGFIRSFIRMSYLPQLLKESSKEVTKDEQPTTH